MFTDNLPFAPFVQAHFEVLQFVMNIVVLLLIIYALASGQTSGGAYGGLVVASMVAIITIIMQKLFKPKENIM